MSQETPQYPQVTQEQIDLWLTNPVTKTYLQCLEWFNADVIDEASTGSIVDTASADVTHAMIHMNLGHQQGLNTAMNHQELLSRYDMVLKLQEVANDKSH